MKVKNILRCYYKTIAWSLVMSYMLFSPANDLPKVKWLAIHNMDKLIHLTMFAVLTFLYLYERFKKSKTSVLVFLLFFLAVFFSSGLSEVIQYYFIPGRSGNIYDLLADITGFAAGLLVFLVYRRLRLRKHQEIVS